MGRLQPWGERGPCKLVKAVARQGAFLISPHCPHALLPHKVRCSLPTFSHTDDLLLLSITKGWLVYTLTGRGWGTTNIWFLNQQLLLWEMRGWSCQPSGRHPEGRWVLWRVSIASCWHRGDSDRFEFLPSRAAHLPRETTILLLSKPMAISLASCRASRQLCITWCWLLMKFPLACSHSQFNASSAAPWVSVYTHIMWPEELIWVNIITSLYARVCSYPGCLLVSYLLVECAPALRVSY